MVSVIAPVKKFVNRLRTVASMRKTRITLGNRILVLGASVLFGYLVGETEGSGSSNYGMFVNHGHVVMYE